MSKHYIDPNINNGRFAEYEEIERDYTYVSYEPGKVNEHAGLGIEISTDKDGNVKGAIIDAEDTNTIIVSSTGAGKTRRVLSHYMLSCICAENSFVVHDPKGELYGFFKTLLEERNYNVRILNLRDPMTGDRFNILEGAARLWKDGQEGRAIEIARGIAETLYLPLEDKNDKFWTATAMNLFLCYFTIAAELLEPEYVTLEAIYKIHLQGTEKVGTSTNMEFYLQNNKEKKCYELGIASVTAPHDTRQSIYAVFCNGLVRLILNDDIADMMTKSTFSVEELASPESPTALFIITRDEAPQVYSTVVAAMVDIIYTTLIDLAHTKYHNSLPRTCHFLLEEMGNISTLNINDMMTASRSRGMRMVLVVQSLCQLHINYTRELAQVLIGNAQNLVFMASTDMDLVEMISRRCGNAIDLYTNETRRLLSPDRLTHLDKKQGETLFLLNRHYPLVGYLPDLSAYKMIKPLKEVNFTKRDRLEKNMVKFAEYVVAIREGMIKEFLDMNGGRNTTAQVTKDRNNDVKMDEKERKAEKIEEGFLAELDRIVESA